MGMRKKQKFDVNQNDLGIYLASQITPQQQLVKYIYIEKWDYPNTPFRVEHSMGKNEQPKYQKKNQQGNIYYPLFKNCKNKMHKQELLNFQIQLKFQNIMLLQILTLKKDKISSEISQNQTQNSTYRKLNSYFSLYLQEQIQNVILNIEVGRSNKGDLIQKRITNKKQKVSYFSCEQSQHGQHERGNSLLSQQQPNISQITIVGWYRLRGMSNQNYLLIQARNKPSQNLIRIVYNPFFKKIYCTILDRDLSPQDIPLQQLNTLQNDWFFIKIGINLNDLNTNMSYIFYTITGVSSTIISQDSQQNSPIKYFDNNLLDYLNGSQVYYPYSRSCSVSKQILAFIGISNNSSQGPFFQTSIQEMSMLSKQRNYFDFVKESSKNNQIFNLAPEYQTCYSTNCLEMTKWPYYKIQGAFVSDYSIDFQEQNGIIISFDLQVSSSDSQYYHAFFALLNQNISFPFLIDYEIGYVSDYIHDCFYDINRNVSDSGFYPISQNEQHHVTVIFQQNFGQILRLFYLDNNLIFNSVFQNMSWKYLGFEIFNVPNIGYLSTNRQISVKSFKLFSGSFFQQCDGCKININNQDCLECQSSNQYLKLNQQNTCQSSCVYPYINLSTNTKLCTLDVSSYTQCTINGQDLFQQATCSCPDGQYFDAPSQKCLNCLYYYKTCQSPFTCDSYLYPQKYNGQCDQNSFDDETQCYDSQSNLQLKLLTDNKDIVLQAYIEADTDTWIGLYYDFLGINLILKYQYQQISYYIISRKNIIKQSLDDPYLVVGIQSPLFQNGYPLCGLIGDNNLIVQGDFSMRNFLNELFQFSEIDIKLIVDFNFLDYQFELEQRQLTFSNNQDPNVTIGISNQMYDFDYITGMLMQFQNEAIINLGNKLNLVPFSIMLQIKPIYYNQCENFYYKILALVLSNQAQIIFKLRSDQYLRQRYYLEVCTYDYYFIKIQYLKFSSNLVQVKFNIVINYVSDETEMQFPFITNDQPIFYNIQLGDQLATLILNNLDYEFILYYSRIQIFLGGFYYLSYENTDPCFIYINRVNMTCIYPKKNYVIKNGIAIPANDCNKNSQLNQQLLYFNQNTKTCQNSGLVIQNCINIDIKTKECIQCIDSKMILPKCQCPDGMFFEQNSNTCKYCSSQCLTCTLSSNNCIACKNNQQIPPQCECIYQDYYLDQNQICRQCNPQCSSCIDNPDQCLTCSQFRVNPPTCNCDTNLYYLDQSSNSCIPKACSKKCKTCNQNNQCTQCKGDRISPPDCICGEGYYDDPSKETCSKCQQGFYYDVIEQRSVCLTQNQMSKTNAFVLTIQLCYKIQINVMSS
ncbi:hypothetical protein ABPG72_017956 [Tetrahymena utriculariae]